MTEILQVRDEKRCEPRKHKRGAPTMCLDGRKVEFPGSVLENFQKAKQSKDKKFLLCPSLHDRSVLVMSIFPKAQTWQW